jgi:hypothetical protein
MEQQDAAGVGVLTEADVDEVVSRRRVHMQIEMD